MYTYILSHVSFLSMCDVRNVGDATAKCTPACALSALTNFVQLTDTGAATRQPLRASTVLQDFSSRHQLCCRCGPSVFDSQQT